jgi:glucose/arabinose dehydrogenase
MLFSWQLLWILLFFILTITCTPKNEFASAAPVINDPKLKSEIVLEGLRFPTSMAFLGPNDFLVLEKENGTVQRIVNGQMLNTPLLDVNVATKSERGMLGIAVGGNTNTTFVFLYFTESRTKDGDDESDGLNPLGNRLYRYELVGSSLINPKLLLDIPASPGHFHEGGTVTIGPDGNVYVVTGDVDHVTEAQNIEGDDVDGTSGILRVNQDGEAIGEGILGSDHPLNFYYAYGIRNSYGIDFDPLTGYLWDTENGPWFGDEINLVEPGFNSGWKKVQGVWEPIGEERGELWLDSMGLVEFGGRGKYSEPELATNNTLGFTAVKFINSDKFGEEYENDLLIGGVNDQAIYHFDLNANRTGLDLTGQLSDKISENNQSIKRHELVKGFGRVTDLEIGPDGYLYVVSHKWLAGPGQPDGTIFRILPA